MSWGPNGHKGAIAITFDNFGESFDIQQSRWPAGKPLGNHHTAVEVLPRLLDDLSAKSIPATFFVEGWNAEIYPRALRNMRSRGHEVALHGWKHERWSVQTEAARKKILNRSVKAMQQIGITLAGFRPPGGAVTDDTNALMKEFDFRYLSAAGDGVTKTDDIVQLPFEWVNVDALYLEPWLVKNRAEFWGDDALRPIGDWNRHLAQIIDHTIASEACTVMVLHPYLLGQELGYFAMFRSFLAQLSANTDLWIAHCDQIAAWVAKQYPHGIALA